LTKWNTEIFAGVKFWIKSFHENEIEFFLDICERYHVVKIRHCLIKTSTEKAKDIWLGADHLSAQYRTKPRPDYPESCQIVMAAASDAALS
jgi:hypothetical protein